ncbi:MAG TPA: sulfotransferase domain-containing protein [Acidiferrobacteraceae bacterium]|nr:sulfotransferase domain-containing protein [Acidiferrobacteraceae bacterium]
MHDPWVLANFKPRPSDVLITTAPKAGTTWMQQILHQLRCGGDPDFESIDVVVPWLECPRGGKSWQGILSGYEAIADPRVFKTHCTYPQTPGADTARLILSSRDPRDCCVSFYHHLLDMTDEARERASIKRPDSFDAYLEPWLEFGAWYRNVQSWWPHRKDDNLLWLRYEDMKADLEGSIDQILQFLGWDLQARAREQALEYCSFGWMRANVRRFTRQGGDKPMFKPGGFIRKGTVGDHKDLLTKEHEKKVLDKAREMLESDCLAFLGID